MYYRNRPLEGIRDCAVFGFAYFWHPWGGAWNQSPVDMGVRLYFTVTGIGDGEKVFKMLNSVVHPGRLEFVLCYIRPNVPVPY